MDGGIGQPVRRKEDLRLLTGAGRYTDDISLENQAHAHFLRASHAHARITHIDVSAARALPGVLAVYTAEDFKADGYAPAMVRGPVVIPPDVLNPPNPGLIPRAGTEHYETPGFAFADGIVHKVGECVALVVAETLALAKDGAELIDVNYEPLPVVIDPVRAMEPDAPQVWDHIPGNVVISVERGDQAATDKAFAEAAHRVKLRLRNNRVGLLPMENRAQVVEYDAAREHFTFYCCQARTFLTQQAMARNLNVEPDQVRIIRGDVGGSFGGRYGAMHENVLTAWAARKIGRPIKWTCERSDGMVSDLQAREQDATAELALDAGGRILGLRVEIIHSAGAV
ncbi:MAG: molybdopterin-dependent oxidoreductase, partial [Proteobacteria bacterium]|nr:molybdopterin-dependent oxidoreductase [Pseudomonadota bacterium]